MLRHFDEGVKAQHRDTHENHPGYQFRSDIYMTYLNEHIEEYRLKRDDIMSEVTDAAGESTTILRLQRALQEFDENFDVIGLVHFNWGHATMTGLFVSGSSFRIRIPSIIKNKYALRYLASQERMCRMSGCSRGQLWLARSLLRSTPDGTRSLTHTSEQTSSAAFPEAPAPGKLWVSGCGYRLPKELGAILLTLPVPKLVTKKLPPPELDFSLLPDQEQ